jgi:multidrug efflux system membrane fusion protein
MNRPSLKNRLWIAAVAGTLTVVVTACQKENPTTSDLLPVHTAVVQLISQDAATKYSANIVPYAQVDLSFKSNGYVERLHQVKNPSGGTRNVDQGDWIPKGTVLAVVSQQDYIDKLQQAQAQLARSQAEQEKARLSFERVSSLYSTQSATKPDYDSAKAQLESTTASVSGAQAQISEAKVALDYCSLRAPFSGWLVKRSVDLGSLVGPATNGFTLADTSSVKAVFGIPDILITRVKPGQHLLVATDALSHSVEGRVSAISPAADPKSRVFSVEVTIPNTRNELKSGMIASLSLEGANLRQPALAVPLAAVIRDPAHANGFAVMRAEGTGDLVSARLQSVELGDTFGNMIVTKGGLSSGERVITTGVTLIKSGDKVRIIQ